MANFPKTVVIVDGENLAIRFKHMKKDGKIPKKDIIYEEDVFVWSPELFQQANTRNEILRISYYTCISGDDIKLKELNDKISTIEYTYSIGLIGKGTGNSIYSEGIHNIPGNGTLNPIIFQKIQNQKRKKVDIAMVIEAFNYSILDNIDDIHFMTGDRDFVPVIQEIMRRGKKVKVSSFSSGLAQELKYTPDLYECLDDYFFEKMKG